MRRHLKAFILGMPKYAKVLLVSDHTQKPRWKYTEGLIVCYLLPVMLASCAVFNAQQLPDIGDGGFLTGTPCGPPCFLGIVPGITIEAEVLAILEPMRSVQKCESFNHEAESGRRRLSCLSMNISFRRGTDIVETIGFQTLQKITVAQVIAKYG